MKFIIMRRLPKYLQLYAVGVTILCLVMSCNTENKKNEQNSLPKKDLEQKLFTSLTQEESGVDFENLLIESAESNYYQYMYSYIGGGVAAEDFNNDGLIDLFFTSNSQNNRLYLNKGNFKFEDITEKANFKETISFNTGVTTVDINNDGYIDIYVGRGGADETQFANLLYVNNGDLTFTERAKEYGLDDDNRAINSVFFDFDNDNDLDVYISNTPDMTSNIDVLDLDEIAKDPKTIALKGSDKLYRNNGDGTFEDISIEAGILPDRGFGLNVEVGDLNNDGWLDVYVNNDFIIPDFVYLNTGKGTFKESRNEVLKHMSFNSMGGDIADVNNDGYLDLLTLDMNPEDYVRSKTTMAMTSMNQFELMVRSNYHHQYVHNML
ncbi:FG-GAP repeat domain-containing protein [Aureibaculum algae]|uniref:FG-GAP repeat domain-containing protein n=1 Tax=Aureibaculum algae TaxID=2584122 RepID=UPI00202A29E8|nr:VCBS repeat-containing protein [Aureibaculum algae]